MHVKLWEAWIKPPDSRKSSRILFDLWVNVHRSALAIRQQRLLSNAGSHHSTQSRAYHTEYDSAAWWDRLLPSTTIACVFTRQRGITLSKQEDVKKSAGTLLFTRRTSLHRHFRFSSPLSDELIKEWLSTFPEHRGSQDMFWDLEKARNMWQAQKSSRAEGEHGVWSQQNLPFLMMLSTLSWAALE